MSKRTRQKRSGSERILWILSLFLVGSMVISLVIVALPSAPAPTPTPYPTITPIPHPTATPSPVPTASPVPATAPAATATLAASPTVTPTASIMPSPTVTPTEPVIGPELPTASPTVTPSLSSLASPNPAAATPLVFAVTGDSRDNPGMYQQILDAVAADGSQFLVNTGDLVAEDQLGLWQDFQAEMVGFSKPFYPVPGNHDTYHGDMNDYLQYSGAPAAHYSFDVASVHMTFADSHDGGIGAAELGWLRNDLSATTQPVKMVFVHHPAFDPDGTDHIMAYGNEQFMNLMAEQGVDYVIAGHIHAYARGERNGVVYIYTGGGGSPLYSGEHPQSFYHYLRITVNSEDVQVEIVRM